ncbi:MAG: hypothetical protein AAGK66_01370 [Pseudomonadota bacterium]
MSSKKVPCIGFIQDGQISDDKQARLKADLNAFTHREFEGEAEFQWISVGRGNGFTKAEPSTSSILSIRPDQAVEQARRVTLLKEVCDIWMSHTGCSLDEIVAAIADPVS